MKVHQVCLNINWNVKQQVNNRSAFAHTCANGSWWLLNIQTSTFCSVVLLKFCPISSFPNTCTQWLDFMQLQQLHPTFQLQCLNSYPGIYICVMKMDLCHDTRLCTSLIFLLLLFECFSYLQYESFLRVVWILLFWWDSDRGSLEVL